MSTPNLELPEVPEAILDASDEITEGFRRLDGIVQLAVLDKDATEPPDNPQQGDRYIVPTTAVGAWRNRHRKIAVYRVDGWNYITPRDGWFAWVSDEEKLYRYKQSSAEWIEYSPSAGGGAANLGRSADSIPEIADPADDEFEIDGALDTAGTRFSGATAWSWNNQGGATATVTQGHLVLDSIADGGSGTNLRMVEQPTPSAPWKYRTKVAIAPVGVTPLTLQAGIILRNTGNSRLIRMTPFRQAASDHRIAVQRYANETTIDSFPVQITDRTLFPPLVLPIYLEAEFDGATLFFRFSANGVAFYDAHSEPIGLFMSAVDRVALFVNSSVAVFDWFRRVA